MWLFVARRCIMARNSVSHRTILSKKKSNAVKFTSLVVALFKRNSVEYTHRTSSLSAAQFTVKSLISSDSQ